MPITDDILEFSSSREPWQQDLLRRLFVCMELTASDFKDVLGMLKAQNGLQEGVAATPIPLAPTHIGHQAVNVPPVTLNSIGAVVNANRLAKGQDIPFGIDGLTIIYGENGSGKSGYCRILKKLCRVRAGGEEEIRGDAFDAASVVSRAEATVRFTVGQQEPTSVRWKDGKDPPEELSRLSVFDAKTASLYADQEGKIEFLPFGLEVMWRLGEACETLGRYLGEEQGRLGQRIAVPLPDVPGGTEVAQLLSLLSERTPPEALPTKAALEAAAAWSDEDAAALQAAERELLDDPEALARNCRRLALTIANVERELREATSELDDTAVKNYRQIWQAAKAAREAAVLAAAQAAGADLLPGFGSDSWRLLFQYAKSYSAVAYPSEEFPVTRDGARCVLCQQLFGEDALDRFATFDAYVKGAAEVRAAGEEEARDRGRGRVEGLALRTPSDAKAIMASLMNEDAEAGTLADLVAGYLESLAERRRGILAAFSSGEWDGILGLPKVPLSELAGARTRLETRADRNEASRKPEVRKKLEKRVDELHARKTLSASLSATLQRREDLEVQSRLALCKRACNPQAVSLKSTELRNRYLTADYESRLLSETAALGLDYLPLKLQGRTDHGASYVGVNLEARIKVRNKDILSQGEFRALALACFLAEVNGIPGQDAVVIDDPVSSLDHKRARRVAKRLVAEARSGRQVIVFTHDLVFFHEPALGLRE